MKKSYFNKLENANLSFSEQSPRVVLFSDTEEMTAQAAMDSCAEHRVCANKARQFALLSESYDPEYQLPAGAQAYSTYEDEHENQRYFLPQECTVQFNPDISSQASEEIIRSLDSRILAIQRTPGYYTISIPEGMDLFDFLDVLNRLPGVSFAEFSEFSVETDVPRQEEADREEEADNEAGAALNEELGQLWGLEKIQMPSAWKLANPNPGQSVVVCVIDTGADLNHPDLKGNLLARQNEDWDFAALDSLPDDEDSHGTHVAGTAIALMNQIGVVGVAPQAKLLPLRINLSAGMNQNRADAINFIAGKARQNPDVRYVVNLSWRMSGQMTAIKTAIQRAAGLPNLILVVAAGNDNRNLNINPQFPAAYPEVIAVSSTDEQDKKSSFSNYGSTVFISAPGSNIYSTVPGGTYGVKSGTSMAAPHVSGLIAWLWSVRPEMSPNDIRAQLKATADPIDGINPSFRGLLGAGRINGLKATQAILSDVSAVADLLVNQQQREGLLARAEVAEPEEAESLSLSS